MNNDFDHEGPTLDHSICGLTVGLFEHLNITSNNEEDHIFKYEERILTGHELKRYRAILLV